MRQQDIQAELRRLFDAMPEAGGIVVWHDPDAEFADVLDALDLPGVEVMRERENELFSLKRTLNEDLSGRRILLWRPRARKLEGDWLADVEVRATPFSADYASVQLRELGAPDTPEMRAELKARRAFLSKRTNVRKLKALAPAYGEPRQLELGVMAVALGSPSLEAAQLLVAYLCRALDEGGVVALGPLGDAGVEGSFRAAALAWTGFAGDVTDADALCAHVLLSALAHTVDAGSLAAAGLSGRFSADHAAFCHEVFCAWLAADREGLLAACREVEGVAGLERALGGLPMDALAQADVFPCVDAVLLRALFSQVADLEAVPEGAEVPARRRGLAWHAEFSHHYDGLEAAFQMRRFCHEHADGLGGLSAARVWEAYTSEWYQMDTWYRRLRRAFSRALMSAESEYGLDEDFRAACRSLENLYKNWYLAELCGRWEQAAGPELAERGYVAGIARQQDFYMDKVDSLARARAWVVVSDALRYEVAAELAERLERETKGTAELTSMQASFPSVTKCGMAALLPHGSLEMREGGAAGDAAPAAGSAFQVLVDGAEVPTCARRQEALRRTHPGAVAVQFDAFVNELDRAGRRALVGEADLVYVYHNAIDATGDKAPTERKVFDACEDAVDELSLLVRLIAREFGASDVLVTADHGFLYTDEPLAPAEHASLADVSGRVVEAGRRYVVAAEPAGSEALLPVAMPAAPGLAGFSPRGAVRLALPGPGENYVHGGASVQELCVPVLRFRNRRAGAKGSEEARPAALSLVTKLDVISNSIVSLELLQEEPVGGKVLPAEYEVFLANAAREAVSDVARVVADRAAADAAERVLRASLTLRTGFSPAAGERAELVARDIRTGQVSVLREVTLQIAFAPSIDFGW